VSYWYFFTATWGVSIEKEHFWKHSFQPKNTLSYDSVLFKKSKLSGSVPEENRTSNLVFQTEFILADYTKILEGVLEYEFRYSAKVLINGKEFSDINRNLISSSLEKDKIKIYEYWRPRKIKIGYEFLQNTLKNGTNTVTIVVYNVEDLKTLESNKKQLSFLSKGRSNKLKSNF
jgi:hypothetical protein